MDGHRRTNGQMDVSTAGRGNIIKCGKRFSYRYSLADVINNKTKKISTYHHFHFYRATLSQARYMPSSCVSVSVCLSVCVSHSGIVSKRLNVGSRKQRRMIAPCSFLMPKIMAKFERDHSLQGRQMQVGWVKIGHFRRKTRYRYNSKTAQDRRIVSIKVE